MIPPRFHFHRWTVWGAPVEDYDGRKHQWRTCCICNKVVHRKLAWDRQCDLNAVKSALRDAIEFTERRDSSNG